MSRPPASPARSLRARALTVAALLALGLAAPAHGASSFLVGQGQDPHVAVDASGTAHITWSQDGTPDLLRYCRVPRGASACTGALTITPPLGDTFARPYVFLPSPGTVLLLTNRCCTSGDDPTLLYTSTDGGASFGAPVQIGTIAPSGDAILGPAGTILAVTKTTTGGTRFQAMPIAGPAVTDRPRIHGDEFSGSVGLSGSTPIVSHDDLHTTSFSRWTGAGSINDASTWTSGVVGAGVEGRLAGGGGGLFLQLTIGTPGNTRLAVRRFDGAAFGAPVEIAGSDSPNEADLFEDAAGRLHSVWRRNAFSPKRLGYATSSNGSAWSEVQDVVTEDDLFDLQAATAADGRGFVVWDQNSGTGQVRAAPLQPVQGTATKQTSVTVGDTVISLLTPRNCIPPGAATARLAVRARKIKRRARGRGRLVVKVSRVVFFVDGRRRLTDRRAPFRATIRLTGLAPGSRHEVRARAHLKVRTGRARSRSIRSRFTICA